jgi:hypothetical protein
MQTTDEHYKEISRLARINCLRLKVDKQSKVHYTHNDYLLVCTVLTSLIIIIKC